MRISVRNLFLIMLFSAIFYISIRPINDPDFWWHLRTGQLMEETQTIPRTDPFSWSAQGNPWVTHEWLSEQIFNELFSLGSFQLLTITFSLIITFAYLFAYKRCPSDSMPYVAGFSLLLGALASRSLWGVRPQMITLLFTSVFLYLFDSYLKTGNAKTLIPIPIIMLLWVNLHAGYILGIVVELTYVAGMLLELAFVKFVRKENLDKDATGKLKLLIFVVAASLLVMPINPAGLRIFAYPFQTLFDSAMQKYIQEWLSPDFHELIWLPLALMLLALIGSGMTGKHRTSITKIILTLGFGFAALRSMRHVPLFAIVVIPILAEQISNLVKIRASEQTPSRPLRLVNTILVIAVAAVMILALVRLPAQQQEAEAKNYPKAAADWIAENQPEGRLFNSYNWGGYLIWRLYPEYPVYIDGRADLYGGTFLTNYMDIYSATSGWEEKLNQENIDIVFVEGDSRLADALKQSPDWEITYEDTLSVIFTAK